MEFDWGYGGVECDWKYGVIITNTLSQNITFISDILDWVSSIINLIHNNYVMIHCSLVEKVCYGRGRDGGGVGRGCSVVNE